MPSHPSGWRYVCACGAGRQPRSGCEYMQREENLFSALRTFGHYLTRMERTNEPHTAFEAVHIAYDCIRIPRGITRVSCR